MRFFLVLAAVLAIGVGTAQGEEILLPEHSQFQQIRIPIPQVIPYDFAKNLSPELYYWWAKDHNERQYAKYANNEIGPSTLRITNRGTLNTRGNLGTGSYNDKTFIREFHTKTGGGPATFYNPYFR